MAENVKDVNANITFSFSVSKHNKSVVTNQCCETGPFCQLENKTNKIKEGVSESHLTANSWSLLSTHPGQANLQSGNYHLPLAEGVTVCTFKDNKTLLNLYRFFTTECISANKNYFSDCFHGNTQKMTFWIKSGCIELLDVGKNKIHLSWKSLHFKHYFCEIFCALIWSCSLVKLEQTSSF